MTIIIMLIIMVIALIAVAVFAGSARRVLVNRLRIVGYDIGTWWNNHIAGHTPTRQELWRAISPAIWLIAILISLMFLAWIPLFILIVTICTSMGSFGSGVFLGLLVIACGFLFILKKIPGFRLVSTISFYLALILLIVFSWNFIFGWWSPGVQESWERLKENQKQELGDWMNETSTKTEGKSGRIGRIDIDKVVGYSEDGMQTYPIAKGKFVRLVSEYKGKKVSKASEGLIWVMFENDFGDFIKGNICLVPYRKVNWDWQSKVSPESAKPSAASAVPSNAILIGKKLQLCWEKEVGQLGTNPDKPSGCVDVTSLKKDGDAITYQTKTDGGGESIASGVKISEHEHQGTWVHVHDKKIRGDWSMKFSPDLTAADGWSRNQGSSEKIHTWIALN